MLLRFLNTVSFLCIFHTGLGLDNGFLWLTEVITMQSWKRKDGQRNEIMLLNVNKPIMDFRFFYLNIQTDYKWMKENIIEINNSTRGKLPPTNLHFNVKNLTQFFF